MTPPERTAEIARLRYLQNAALARGDRRKALALSRRIKALARAEGRP